MHKINIIVKYNYQTIMAKANSFKNAKVAITLGTVAAAATATYIFKNSNS